MKQRVSEKLHSIRIALILWQNTHVALKATSHYTQYCCLNGNLIGHGDLEGGKHYSIWKDPFKKPCYLFALVVARLESRDNTVGKHKIQNTVTNINEKEGVVIQSKDEVLCLSYHSCYSAF